MDKRIAFVILGGSIGRPEYLRAMWVRHHPLAIICANGGAKHAQAAGLEPTLIVGDLDSLSEERMYQLREAGAEVHIYPREKDETDAVIALKKALELAPEEIWVFGALGGRPDHMLANLSLLLMGEMKGVFVKLVDERCELFLAGGEKEIEGNEGDLISLLAVFEDARGVTLEGFLYPLERGTITRDFPLGVSNHMMGNKAKIKIEEGKLLIIKYFSSLRGQHECT